MDLLLSSTSIEALYVIRIALGKLRLGVSDATILAGLCQAYAPEQDTEPIELGYNFHPDLGEIGMLLQAGETGKVLSMGPTPMIPARVMLAERLPEIAGIIQKMEGPAAFEYKYDGLRTQIHLQEGHVEIYSRSSENTTGSFPDIVEAVKRTFTCSSCILDGEAVPYNPETGELYPFQMVSLRRGRIYEMEKARKDIPVAVFLFDIIYLNGEALNNLPYPARREILEKVFTPNDYIRLASRLISNQEAEIEGFMEKAISDGCEGLVAKKMSGDSIYRAGARGWLWIKLKRDYQSGFSDSLDLVVIGAFHGHGRRKGTYGALLMAAYNKEDDTFESICKLGTGFSDELLMKLPEILADFKVKEKPARIVSEMVPDVWIYPKVVMEIIGAEITLSPVHRCAFNSVKENAGLAVRFPRFTGKFREDKDPENATSSSEIIEIFRNQKKKS
jgi:DNA ligase-1